MVLSQVACPKYSSFSRDNGEHYLSPYLSNQSLYSRDFQGWLDVKHFYLALKSLTLWHLVLEPADCLLWSISTVLFLFRGATSGLSWQLPGRLLLGLQCLALGNSQHSPLGSWSSVSWKVLKKKYHWKKSSFWGQIVNQDSFYFINEKPGRARVWSRDISDNISRARTFFSLVSSPPTPHPPQLFSSRRFSYLVV